MVRRAAERMQTEHPGPRLMVGDLSRQRGGRLAPHSSHQNGRDVDLGFFVTDDDNAPVEPPRFLELDHAACATERGTAYCFDPARTFQFFAALLSDPEARVQFILIAADLRQRLLAAGRRMEIDDALRERVSVATEPRDGSESHRSHFHVRIYCPTNDRPRCQDGPPYQSWYEGEPPQPTVRRARRHSRRHRARIRRRRARRR